MASHSVANAFSLQYRPSSTNDTPYWTTNQGAPVWNNNSSLTVGPRGPILLEDYHLVEKLAQFNRERIPERVVHARGTSAKGFFEVRTSSRGHLVPAIVCQAANDGDCSARTASCAFHAKIK